MNIMWLVFRGEAGRGAEIICRWIIPRERHVEWRTRRRQSNRLFKASKYCSGKDHWLGHRYGLLGTTLFDDGLISETSFGFVPFLQSIFVNPKLLNLREAFGAISNNGLRFSLTRCRFAKASGFDGFARETTVVSTRLQHRVGIFILLIC